LTGSCPTIWGFGAVDIIFSFGGTNAWFTGGDWRIVLGTVRVKSLLRGRKHGDTADAVTGRKVSGFSSTIVTKQSGFHRTNGYFSFAYSALAATRTGMFVSASSQSARKS
jgi:hypothetical protein